jgi:cytochrome P450
MNIFPPLEQRLNPFKFYATMRESNPIAYDDKNNLWGIFRYYDVQSILGDYTHFSSNPPNPQHGKQLLEDRRQLPFSRPSLLKSDPPYHRVLRGVIASAFTPMAIARLETRIENVANHLVDRVIKEGNMDLISDLAYPLPVTVIAELLGIPVEDRNIFQDWADKLVSSAGGELNDQPNSTKNLITIQSEMDEYFGPIIDNRSKDPQQDLISSLIKAEADGNHLTKEEILAFCTLLLLAGHVTTVNLIGNAVLSLLQYQEQIKLLKDDISYSLIPSAIEETLRYRSPVQAVFRITNRGAKVADQSIDPGQGVVIWLGSANHDEKVFPDPDKFDISRSPQGHSHVGFGHGIHFCLGAPLARLEGKVAIKVILERLKDLQFEYERGTDLVEGLPQNVKPLHSLFFHGVSSLPLRFRPAIPIGSKSD